MEKVFNNLPSNAMLSSLIPPGPFSEGMKVQSLNADGIALRMRNASIPTFIALAEAGMSAKPCRVQADFSFKISDYAVLSATKGAYLGFLMPKINSTDPSRYDWVGTIAVIRDILELIHILYEPWDAVTPLTSIDTTESGSLSGTNGKTYNLSVVSDMQFRPIISSSEIYADPSVKSTLQAFGTTLNCNGSYAAHLLNSLDAFPVFAVAGGLWSDTVTDVIKIISANINVLRPARTSLVNI